MLLSCVEMKPQWFDNTAVPFDNMWEDDKHWFPFMLQGTLFYGYFVFDGDKMLSLDLKQVAKLSDIKIPQSHTA